MAVTSSGLESRSQEIAESFGNLEPISLGRWTDSGSCSSIFAGDTGAFYARAPATCIGNVRHLSSGWTAADSPPVIGGSITFEAFNASTGSDLDGSGQADSRTELPVTVGRPAKPETCRSIPPRARVSTTIASQS